MHNKKKMPLTPQLQRAFNAIVEHLRVHKRPPTQKELAGLLGLKSRNGAHTLVLRLEERGWITTAHSRAGSIQLMEHHCPKCGEPL